MFDITELSVCHVVHAGI